MGIFLRGLWKQKPGIYGPPEAVQRNIFMNAERAGIDPGSIALCMPMWGPGDQIDYVQNIVGSLGSSLSYDKNSIISGNTYNDANNVINLGNKLDPRNWPGITIFFVGTLGTPALTEYPGICGNLASGEYYDNWNLNYGREAASHHLQWRAGQNTTQAQINDDLTGANTIVASWTKSSTARLYVDGALRASQNQPNGWDTNNYTSYINGYYRSGWRTATSTFYKSLSIFNLELTPSQITHLSDNPYFLLARNPARTWFVPSGAITIKNITDTCTGTDSISQISNILSVSDVGAGADGFAGLTAGLSVSDTGSGVDAVQSAVSLSVQDTGSAVDLIQQISAACSVVDAGTGADSIGQLLASLVVSDTGAGADVIAVLKELLKTVTDSGTGTDAVSQILASLSVADTGSGTDSISQILADISVSDTGSGADFINLLKDILKTISDTGSGTDSVSVQPVSVSVQDAGTALDLIGHIAVALSVSDAGTISEIISTIKTKMVTVTDAGTGTDAAPTISVSLTVSDTAAALDVVGQVLNALTVSDTGSGLEAITKTDFDLLPSGKVTVTFTMKTPGATFDLKTPGATFTIK